MTRARLEDQARDFAEELTATVQSLVPDCPHFSARVLTTSGGHDGFTVRQTPTQGIVLTVRGQPLLRLIVSYKCSMDTHGKYLAVDESAVKVMAIGTNEPLFRYEYDRQAVPDMPAAHIQIHAHRDAFSHVMNRAGTSTPRGSRRANATSIARIQDLHFPVGGHRFRPCLEDVLEMLVLEFGVDSTTEGRLALRRGRESWRRRQVGSVVRDAPSEAIRVLTELGYVITLPDGAPGAPDDERRLWDL